MKYIKSALLAITTIVLLVPSLASAATFTRNLGIGSMGTEVSSLQQFLKDEGIYSGSLTAYFGPTTARAVKAFQQQESITPASGYFGTVTRVDAEKVIAAHPEWTTTVSNNKQYTNVDGATVHSPAYAPQTPAGATAECRDGTYSFSLHHSGSCSHHGGVSQWL